MNHSHRTHEKLIQFTVSLLNSAKIDQLATPTEKARESSNEETPPIHGEWIEQPIENDVRSQGDSTKSRKPFDDISPDHIDEEEVIHSIDTANVIKRGAKVTDFLTGVKI